MATEPTTGVELEGESSFMRILGLRFEEMAPTRVVAEPLQQGKSQQLWQVLVAREDGKTVARGQVRLPKHRG